VYVSFVVYCRVTWSSTPINSAFFHVKSAQFRNPPVTPVESLQLHATMRVDGRELNVKASDVSGVMAQRTHRFEQGDYQNLQRSPAFQRGFVNMDGVRKSFFLSLWADRSRRTLF
jgi:hypothetical protein